MAPALTAGLLALFQVGRTGPLCKTLTQLDQSHPGSAPLISSKYWPLYLWAGSSHAPGKEIVQGHMLLRLILKFCQHTNPKVTKISAYIFFSSLQFQFLSLGLCSAWSNFACDTDRVYVLFFPNISIFPAPLVGRLSPLSCLDNLFRNQDLLGLYF